MDTLFLNSRFFINSGGRGRPAPGAARQAPETPPNLKKQLNPKTPKPQINEKSYNYYLIYVIDR